MTKTRGKKIGFVNQKKWLAQGDIAKRSIVTTGAVTAEQTWVSRTWESIANGTLEKWQEDYLVSINFPKTKVESDRRRKAFREAKTARNIAVMTTELEEKGTNLLPWQIKMACGGYKRTTCKHLGGCNKVAAIQGLCKKHYNETAAASLVPSQPANKDDGLVLTQPIAVNGDMNDNETLTLGVADWTAAKCEFVTNVMDGDVVFEDMRFQYATSDFPTPAEWSEELTNWAAPSAWSKLPTGYEWEEI